MDVSLLFLASLVRCSLVIQSVALFFITVACFFFNTVSGLCCPSHGVHLNTVGGLVLPQYNSRP